MLGSMTGFCGACFMCQLPVRHRKLVQSGAMLNIWGGST